MELVNISKEMGMFIGIFIYVLLIGMSMKWIPVIGLTVIFPLFFSLILAELWKKHPQPILNIAVLVLGIIYVVIPFYLTVDLSLRNKMYLPSVAAMLILIWTNDTMAYFVGKKWGRKKLFERISPKKTWEGTVGGLTFTVLMGILIGLLINKGQVGFWVVSALIIGPCAIFGDLLESLFKRSLNIKDSGSILPGHGGVLDRFDAALFSIPFFYCWYMLYFYW
jgi:phosphatidate cytidylyltransferase